MSDKQAEEVIEIGQIDWDKIIPEKMSRVHARALVPEDVQDVLIHSGEQISESQWVVADNALYMVEEYPNIPKAVVDRAVGIFARLSEKRIADMRATALFYPKDECHECGSPLFRGERAERDRVPDGWCDHCQKVSQDVREQYSDVCSFSHYLYAKAAGTLEKACKYLEDVVISMDEYQGNPMGVTTMRAKMAAEGHGGTPIFIQQVRSVGRSFVKFTTHQEYPVELREAFAEAIDLIRTRLHGATYDWVPEVMDAFGIGQDDQK